MRYIIIFASLCLALYAMPTAYLYPVLAMDEENVLVCYQPNSENLELYIFNMNNHSMTKIISSQFQAAGVRLLPDMSGISFVDNGMIRIKRFATRYVKTVEIFDPLYGIDFIEWRDVLTCYFHALSDGVFGIYSLSVVDECVEPLVVLEGVDCMYPQIVDSTLFYIERRPQRTQNLYTIQHKRSHDTASSRVLTMGNKQIGFLKMLSLTEGYFVEYELMSDSIIFRYHRLIYDTAWHNSILFTFSLSKSLFSDSPNRLYESLMPFLPRHINDEIYYSSQNGLDKVCLYAYNLISTHVRQVADYQNILFSPVKVKDKLVVGTQLSSSEIEEPVIYHFS